MLVYKQIKTLAKPYSDRAMVTDRKPKKESEWRTPPGDDQWA